MERRKTKISAICVSIIVILSVILAVFGVTSTNNNQTQGKNFNLSDTNLETTAVVDRNGDGYLAGVDGGTEAYIDSKLYASNTGWKEIKTAQNLKDFLMDTGDYAGKNGYLSQNITDFNWNGIDGNPSQLAPLINFRKVFDGCGCTVTFNGTGINEAESDTDSGAHYPANTNYKIGYKVEGSRSAFIQGSSYTYRAFGGFASVMTGGEIKNFKFVIDSDHYFAHDQDGNVADTVNTRSVSGGLVGYQSGGTIDNVIVELAANRKFGVRRTRNGVSNGAEGTVITGLAVAVCDGGTISNTTSILNSGSNVKSYAYGHWEGTTVNPRTRAAIVFAGGVVGYAENPSATVKNVALYVNGDGLITSSTNTGTSGVHDTWEYAGGIVGYAAMGVNVASAMVSGNLDCLTTGSRTDEINARSKNIYVGGGPQPSSMIYLNANGGINNNGAGAGNSNSANRNEGYTNNSEKIMITTDNNVVAYFDKKIDGNIQLFIPEVNILWSFCGVNQRSKLITGKAEDDSRRSLAAPLPSQISSDSNGNRRTTIEIGISSTGELGIYKRDLNGADMEASYDSNGNLQPGRRFTEMSDQTRATQAGTTEIPTLYYTGDQYELKIKIKVADQYGTTVDRLFDEGLRVRNIGDLKNARSSYGGRPVKLYCDSDIAYIDENRKIIIMLDDVINDSMLKTLTIDKRYVWVETNNYKRGETDVFGGATVRFGKIYDDSNINSENTGLVDGEYIMWQDEPFEEDVDIKLNVAGHQLLRPSTNNYILRNRVYYDEYDHSLYYDQTLGSYFAAVIVPHTIKVDEHIYINGASLNGEYNVKNARTDNPNYNDTKRKLVITARVNDNHFTAKRVVIKDKSGNEVTRYIEKYVNDQPQYKNIEWKEVATGSVLSSNDWTNVNGLVVAEIYINDTEIASIEFDDSFAETLYEVSVKVGDDVSQKSDYRYGDRIYLNAPTIDGKSFVGWQRAKDNSFIAYTQKYSLKVTENFYVTAIYEDITTEKPWTHRYYGRYNFLQREAKSVDENPIEGYVLPVTMGWKFDGWQAKVDYDTKTAEFYAKFVKRSDDTIVTYPKEPTVNVVWVNPSVPEIETEYATPIKLEANKTYLVNGAKVVVEEDPLTIYAITDLTIEEIDPNNGLIEIAPTSMDYHSFKWDNKVENSVETYYINITFVYGEVDDVYDNSDNLPTISMTGFDANDFSQFNRYGNVYQLIMIITATELECRFGNDSEIATFLTVDDYTFDNILIFRRSSTDTTGQRSN